MITRVTISMICGPKEEKKKNTLDSLEQIRNDSRGRREERWMAFSWGNWPGKATRPDGRKTGQKRKLNAQPIVIDNRCRLAEPWMIPGSNQSDVLGQKSLRIDGPNSAGRIGPAAPRRSIIRAHFTCGLGLHPFGLHSGCSFARPRRLRVIFPIRSSQIEFLFCGLDFHLLFISLFLFSSVCGACFIWTKCTWWIRESISGDVSLLFLHKHRMLYK